MSESIPRGEGRVRMRKLVSWGLVGQISYVISQFILLMALARFASVEEVGRFGFASAIIIPVFFFFNLGLRVNQATDVAHRFSFNEFVYIRTIATALGCLVILIIAFTVLDPATRLITLVFGAAKAAETFSDFFYGVFQRAERLDYVARSLAVRGFGSAVLFTIILAGTGSTGLAFLANLAVWVVVAIFVDYLPARRIAVRDGDIGPVRKDYVRELVRSSLPLGVNQLLSGLQGNLPRYIIGWMIGIAALGQFTVVSYAMQAVMTVTNAVGQSISARLAHYVASGNRRAYMKFFHVFLLFVTVAGVAGTLLSYVIGDWLIEFVFGSNYAGLGLIFALCILASVLRACVIILQSGLFAFRDFHLNMILRCFSIGLMFAACLIGAWSGGLIGLCWGMILTFFVHSVALWAALQRKQFIAPD
ncbi:lipopolysaccharide biosynthesis protein [Amaricoccus macauensis]|uniref:lipopolysaccharide biosynthesis protein n=1 Tax=Amaricoccus macauensis TaxID=57001 RepID=UPI003C7E8A84